MLSFCIRRMHGMCVCVCARAFISEPTRARTPARRRRRFAVTRRPRHWLCVSAALRLCRCVTQFPRTGVERQQQSVQHHSTNLRGAAARVLTLTYICWPTKQKRYMQIAFGHRVSRDCAHAHAHARAQCIFRAVMQRPRMPACVPCMHLHLGLNDTCPAFADSS